MGLSGSLDVAKLQKSASDEGREEISSQSSLSFVPAPPRAYIHRLSGTPSSFAKSVDVKIMAPARFIVLKAFISSGSVTCQCGSLSKGYQLTREANHAVLLGDSPNDLWCRCLPIIPRIWLFLGHLRKTSIQLRGFVIVVSDRLPPMCSITILKQRIDMNWGTYLVDCSKICR